MRLTENRRIFLNVCATYARTLLNVACGLFSVRWVLMALGQEDFGLYGVVGGLIVFMTFINGLFSNSLSRFYAYSIGEMKVAEDKMAALEECRSWFSSSVSIQTIVPVILLAIGYPVGAYGITHSWLSIPPDRISACVWVWRCSCFTALTSMMAAPIWAMYMAKQNIAEMTGYYMLSTLIRTGFIYSMTLFPRDWLALYAMVLCGTGFAVRLCYTIQAFIIFPECRIRRKALLSLPRWRRLALFSGWQGFMGLGQIVKGQGMAILVNRLFGARVNAAMGVATQLAGESAALAGALQGAFAPAVTTACGACEYDKMRMLAFRVCRYSTQLMLLFAIPLALEVDEVLHLWLKTPPQYASGLCLCLMIAMVLEKCSLGHTIAVTAKGDISKYCFVHGFIVASVIFVAWCFVGLGGGVYWMGGAIVFTTGLAALADVLIARTLVGMGFRVWIAKVIIPIGVIVLVTVAAGMPSVLFLQKSFVRICVTTLSCLMAFIPVSVWSLEKEERVKMKVWALRFVGR